MVPPPERVPEIKLEPTNCPLCGANRFRPYLVGRDLQYGVPGEFQLARCCECRHVYMNPRPTAESIPDCYPSNYNPHRPEEPVESAARSDSQPERRPWYLSAPVRMIPGLRGLYYWLADGKAEIVPSVSASSPAAVEIGCAAGRFLAKLQQQGWRAHGVELAQAAANEARVRGLDVHQGTLESAEFPDHSFDAAFAWMVIEHLPDPRTTLSEVRRILKPGGWFCFSVPNAGCWEPRVFGRHWYAYDLPRHLQHFTPGTVRRLLATAELECVHIVHQRNLLNVVGSLGFRLQSWHRNSRLASRLVQFTHDPTMWWQIAMAPTAKVLAILRQGGRLTVLARRPSPNG